MNNVGPNGHRWRWIAVLAAFAMLVAACGDDDETSAEGSPSSESEAPGSGASDEEPYKIGLMVELTGNLSFLGESSQRAAEVALDVVNAQDGRPIEIVTCDTRSEAERGLECWERLVERDGVDAILGPGATPVAEAIAPMTDSGDVVNYVLAGGYGERDMNGHQYQFAGHVVTEDVLTGVWEWARQQGFEDAYMITIANATGEACTRFAHDEEWAEESEGIELLGEDTMEVSAQTAAPQMANVPSEADFVMICVSGNAGQVAATSYAQAGLEMPGVLTHSSGVPAVADALAGRVPPGLIHVPSFCVLPAATGELTDEFVCSDKANSFAEAFAEKYPDVTPDVLGAAAYDGLLQLAEAARSTDGSAEAVRGWFEEQTAWEGAFGVYRYSEDVHRGLGPDATLMAVLEDDGWHLSDMLDVPTR